MADCIESITQDESGIVCEFSYDGQQYEAVMDDFDGEAHYVTIYRGYDPDSVHIDCSGNISKEKMIQCVRDFIAELEGVRSARFIGNFVRFGEDSADETPKSRAVTGARRCEACAVEERLRW